MIFARAYQLLTVADLFDINYSSNEADLDVFETNGIPQRDVLKKHAHALHIAALKAFNTNPEIGVFPTPMICRLLPKKNKQDKLVKALQSGRDWKQYVQESYFIDGQHRATGLLEIDAELHPKIKFDATLIVCDDSEAEVMFYAINGLQRKMAPAVVGLSLGHQLLSGVELNETETVRAISTLITKSFMDMGGHPYANLIEVPFKRPPNKAVLRFHRTTNSCKFIARDLLQYTDDLELLKEQIEISASRMANCWAGIAQALHKEIFGPTAEFGNTRGFSTWSHGHLFGIMNVTIVEHVFNQFPKFGFDTELPKLDTPMDYANFVRPALAGFFDEMKQRNDEFFMNGFNGLAGEAADAKYIKILSGYLSLCGEQPKRKKDFSTLAALTQKYEEQNHV